MSRRRENVQRSLGTFRRRIRSPNGDGQDLSQQSSSDPDIEVERCDEPEELRHLTPWSSGRSGPKQIFVRSEIRDRPHHLGVQVDFFLAGEVGGEEEERVSQGTHSF